MIRSMQKHRLLTRPTLRLQKEAVEPDEELAGQQLSVLFEKTAEFYLKKKKNKFLDNVTLLC